MALINHVALKVTDLEAATKFYENVFGFRQVETGCSRDGTIAEIVDFGHYEKMKDERG